MLAQTLKTLESDGLVHRDAQPVIPPRVDYSLTDRGHELAALLMPLVAWVAEHADEAVAGTSEQTSPPRSSGRSGPARPG
jgi:DNA-binding HxlR family transcriptional regulator